MLAVGVDTGGTFTDFAWIEGASLRTLKVPSTPGDPAQAVLQGLAEIHARSRKPLAVVLGTTVATNALLTGRGARIAFVTTLGFEDALEIGRQARPELYVLDGTKPDPIVPRELRLGVHERTAADGSILTPLHATEIARVVRAILRAKVEGVAVGLLHGHANPRHERLLARAFARHGLPVSASADICPLPREYERFVLTAANARVAPLLHGHLRPLQKSLGRGRLRLTMADGGSVSSERSVGQAVRTILSGPAGGLIAASAYFRRLAPSLHRLEGLATLDVGGTSSDCGFAARRLARTMEARVGSYPFVLPALEVTSVGAGGGSIARIDRGGALAVGPDSAGADPGPACHGRSELPTVTDAFVVLGLIDPEVFLGGRMKLFPERSFRVLRALALGARLPVRKLAMGIIDLAVAEMARGIRCSTLARGRDPRRLALFGFGGAGGLFAAALMADLGFPIAIIPPAPGALSALGCLLSPMRLDAVTAIGEPLGRWPAPRRRRVLRSMERRLRREMAHETDGPVVVRFSLDLCYRGQSYHLPVDEDARPGAVERAFAKAHASRYGVAHDAPLDLQALRARAEAPGARATLPEPPAATLRRTPRGKALRREQLAPGFRGTGPLVISEETGTTVVPAGFGVTVDRSLCLLLRRIP